LFLFFFFPVGFYLIYKRFTVNQTNVQRNYEGLNNTGIILLIFSVIYLILGFSGVYKTMDESTAIDPSFLPSIVFGISAFIFFRKAYLTKAYAKKYTKYNAIIINQKERMIDNIASNMGITYETAIADLQKMLSLGYFPGAYIDEINRELIILEQSTSNTDKPYKTKVVICKSCGANNTVLMGCSNECEYCGSQLD